MRARSFCSFKCRHRASGVRRRVSSHTKTYLFLIYLSSTSSKVYYLSTTTMTQASTITANAVRGINIQIVFDDARKMHHIPLEWIDANVLGLLYNRKQTDAIKSCFKVNRACPYHFRQQKKCSLIGKRYQLRRTDGTPNPPAPPTLLENIGETQMDPILNVFS